MERPESQPRRRTTSRPHRPWNCGSADNRIDVDYLAQHGSERPISLKTMDSRGRAHRFATSGIVQSGRDSRRRRSRIRYGLFIDEPKPGDPDGRIDTKIDYATYGPLVGAWSDCASPKIRNSRMIRRAQADWKKPHRRRRHQSRLLRKT